MTLDKLKLKGTKKQRKLLEMLGLRVGDVLTHDGGRELVTARGKYGEKSTFITTLERSGDSNEVHHNNYTITPRGTGYALRVEKGVALKPSDKAYKNFNADQKLNWVGL
ncbi:hypothetical protein HYT24_01505 [Candidatus Pacearchaeota archaeon]|nr:hypothetical protein [Candidatus Pacearchaeota archaeon]